MFFLNKGWYVLIEKWDIKMMNFLKIKNEIFQLKNKKTKIINLRK